MDPKSENMNDTFLSDWMAGKISDQQLKQLVTAADFDAYLTLRKSLDAFRLAEPDVDSNFTAVKLKLAAAHDRKPQRKVLPLYKYALIAAMLLVIIGLYQLLAFSNSVVTGYGKTETLVFSDQSTVTLNSKSTVSFPTLFEYNRTIKLEGEAFFEVQKGRTFTVKTAHGEIQVLGTKFNVNSCDEFFEVVCYEGKVKVSNNSKSTILTYGKAIRIYENVPEKWEESLNNKPLWMIGESSFRNVPLHCVISQWQNQYDFEVEYPEHLKQVRFTGTFTNKNVETSLKSICVPMNLKFVITDTGKIIISE